MNLFRFGRSADEKSGSILVGGRKIDGAGLGVAELPAIAEKVLKAFRERVMPPAERMAS